MTRDDPNATAAESAVGQIGAEFRRLRNVRGERLEDIADYLDVKAIYLYGIEQGDLSVIPGKGEAKVFVRSYADYLGLDGGEIIGRMTPIIASLQGDKAPPTPQRLPSIDRVSAMILGSAVLLGVLVGWSYIGQVNQFDLLAPPSSAEAVDILSTDDEPPAGQAEGPSAEQALSDLRDEATSAVEAVVAENTTERKERPANVLAALVAERGDGAHIYEAENTDARVIVRALAEVSVQVTSDDKDYIWTRTMKPKEMLLVPHRDDLELWTGDGAAVEILVDGVVLPPLGPPGAVVSGLSLAADNLNATASAGLQGGDPKPTF
jgi:cytoskeleton protein RodZ